MTRKKVKLVWIVNDAARKASLKKRRLGLLKKVSELTTLCGVDAFAIIYSPEESEPMVWPSRPQVEDMLMRFQSIPEIERSKKMMNQESYLKERMGKLQEQSRKDAKKNREMEMSYLMGKLHNNGHGIDAFDVSEMKSLIWLLEEKIRGGRRRVDFLQKAPPLDPLTGSFLEPQPLAPPLPLPLPPHEGIGEIRSSHPNDGMVWDQWFFDMMNNSDNVASGSGGGARNDHMMMAPPPPLPPPLPPHGYNLSGFHGGGMDAGVLGLGPPSGGANSFDIGMIPHHGNPNLFDLGFPSQSHYGDFPGENPMGFAPLPPPTTAAGGEEGLQGLFGGENDMGMPWPPYFSS